MAESSGIYEGNSFACLDLEECREAKKLLMTNELA